MPQLPAFCMHMRRMLGQSRSQYCKPVVVFSVGIVLLLVVILYIATRSDSKPAAAYEKSVRFLSPKPPPVSIAETKAKLNVLPTLGPSSPQGKSKEAYVALQYGGFFLALRVLGQSLRESGTSRDMVALCMPDVPPYQREILKRDGWIIKPVGPLPKECVGNHLYSRHFVKVQTWLLTEYRRVVLIDSDAIALKNIDALFNCGEFCAAYRHSDLFNTGVVVIKPSENAFRNICANIQVFGSFTNGDQGFLNYYYEDLKRAPLFSHATDSSTISSMRFQRLPSEYNGDVSVFYLANKWMYLDTEEPYVLHYTLGPVKPWIWWTYPLFSLNWRWQAIRDRLPPTSFTEPSLHSWESWIPIPLLLAMVFFTNLWYRRYTRLVSNCSVVKGAAAVFIRLSPVSTFCTKLFPAVTLFLACYWAFFHVPLTMNPAAAWTRYGLWILLFFSLPFSVFCHLAYILGMHAPVYPESENGSASVHKHTSVTSWRVVGEILLWLALSVCLFYMQFSVTLLQVTMKKRAISFFVFAIANVILCCWYGRHLPSLCYELGSCQVHNSHNSFKIPSPFYHNV